MDWHLQPTGRLHLHSLPFLRVAVPRLSAAHIDGLESELVVRSGHSTQAKSETIEEVRRILYEHAGIH